MLLLFVPLVAGLVLLFCSTLLLRRSIRRKASALREAEATLKEKNALLETLFQTMPFGLWVRDRDNRLLMQNERNAASHRVTLGHTPEEDGVATGLSRLWRTYLEQALQGESFDMEVREEDRDIRKIIAPIRSNGVTRAVLGIDIDITEIKQFEAQLQATETTFRGIFDNAPVGIFRSTLDGGLISINNAFATTFGYPSPEEMLDQVQDIPGQLYAAPEQRRRIIGQLQTTEALVIEDVEFLRRDGSPFFGTIYVRVVPDDGGSAPLSFDGFMIESTERRQTQEILLQHEKMLMIGGLAAGMAHEINNPLGIIAQDLQNLQRRLSPDLPANRQAAQRLGLDLHSLQAYLSEREITGYLYNIREAVQRTSRIIDNMLQFSHRDSSRQLAPLHEVIEHALELAGGDYELRKRYRFHELCIERSYAPDLPLVPLNVTEIEQVLINLLKNAAQAMAGWPGERSIRISTRRDSDYVVLNLCDSGPGMTEEIRLRVFDPFFTTKPPGVGTGLGLTVSHAIITKSYKGRIAITSSPGKGCCCMIRIPLTQDKNHV